MYLKKIAPIVIMLLLALLLPRPGSTHEPITTKVMFNKEIIRIFQRNCLGCHSIGRIKSDIPLTTYEEARPWAKAIKEEVLEKRMMPYQAVKGYGAFQHDYILPQRDLDLIVSWVEGGAPRGEDKDYPRQAIDQILKGDDWTLGQPDLILEPESAVKVAAEGDHEVRCFALPVISNEDRWISAYDFHPGNGSVVYGASFFIERNARKAGNRTDESCAMSGEAANLESLGQWVPGQAVNHLPNGIGRLLPANSSVLLKIHYRKNGEATTDRSRLGLYFAKDRINKAARTVIIGPIIDRGGKRGIAGNGRVRATHTVTAPTEAVAIRPLLFPYAESMEARAYRPDGTIEVLIWTKRYRFDWQPVYYFRRPLALPRGTRIEVTAYLNGSDGDGRSGSSAGALCEITLTANSVRTSRLQPAPAHRRG
jgi:hypothetical protein